MDSAVEVVNDLIDAVQRNMEPDDTAPDNDGKVVKEDDLNNKNAVDEKKQGGQEIEIQKLGADLCNKNVPLPQQCEGEASVNEPDANNKNAVNEKKQGGDKYAYSIPHPYATKYRR